MRSKKERQLLEALETAACSQGFDLVEIEQASSGHNTLLRVYVDKPGGLTLDDVASASTWVSEVVETLDPYKGSYTLEVSSPGIDRPLRTLAHFQNAIGEETAITLDGALVSANFSSHDGDRSKETVSKSKPRLKYTGSIVAVNPQQELITLEANGAIHTIEFAQIKKAKIKGRLDFEARKDN